MSHSKPPLPTKTLSHIRALRKNATDPEHLLWYFLRNRSLGGYKFRRQHPFGNYIIDFYCHERKLGIEIDGSGHLETTQMDYDLKRSKFLQDCGIRVLRFWNHEVSNQTQRVLEVIWDALNEDDEMYS